MRLAKNALVYLYCTHTHQHTRMHRTHLLLYIYITCAYMYTAKKRPVRSVCNHSPVWLPPRRSVSSGSFVGGSGCAEGKGLLLLCAGRRAKAGPYTNSRQLAGRRRVSSYPLGGNARSRARSIVSRSCGCLLSWTSCVGPLPPRACTHGVGPIHLPPRATPSIGMLSLQSVKQTSTQSTYY